MCTLQKNRHVNMFHPQMCRKEEDETTVQHAMPRFHTASSLSEASAEEGGPASRIWLHGCTRRGKCSTDVCTLRAPLSLVDNSPEVVGALSLLERDASKSRNSETGSIFRVGSWRILYKFVKRKQIFIKTAAKNDNHIPKCAYFCEDFSRNCENSMRFCEIPEFRAVQKLESSLENQIL